MTKAKELKYKKAYTELYEFVSNLDDEQKNKIPKNVLENLKNDKDNNYYFKFDKNKGLFEQNYMTETKALIVELYEKYLAPEEELVLWKKYNYLCNNAMENEKKKTYNPDVFKNKKSPLNEEYTKKEENALIEVDNKKENFIKKIIKKIKRKFKKM